MLCRAELARARHLVDRIRKRDLYVQVDGAFVKDDFRDVSKMDVLQDIVNSTVHLNIPALLL